MIIKFMFNSPNDMLTVVKYLFWIWVLLSKLILLQEI